MSNKQVEEVRKQYKPVVVLTTEQQAARRAYMVERMAGEDSQFTSTMLETLKAACQKRVALRVRILNYLEYQGRLTGKVEVDLDLQKNAKVLSELFGSYVDSMTESKGGFKTPFNVHSFRLGVPVTILTGVTDKHVKQLPVMEEVMVDVMVTPWAFKAKKRDREYGYHFQLV